MIKLFERMNMLKKAYYASDASMPLKTQLQVRHLYLDAPYIYTGAPRYIY